MSAATIFEHALARGRSRWVSLVRFAQGAQKFSPALLNI